MYIPLHLMFIPHCSFRSSSLTVHSAPLLLLFIPIPFSYCSFRSPYLTVHSAPLIFRVSNCSFHSPSLPLLLLFIPLPFSFCLFCSPSPPLLLLFNLFSHFIPFLFPFSYFFIRWCRTTLDQIYS